MWEWAVRYNLGLKRCGSRGWVFDPGTALDRVKVTLEGLPYGVAATGQVVYLPPGVSGSESPHARVTYDAERTPDGVIHWHPKEDGTRP